MSLTTELAFICGLARHAAPDQATLAAIGETQAALTNLLTRLDEATKKALDQKAQEVLQASAPAA